MSSKLRQGWLLGMIISLVIFSVIVSYAETINYVYDDLNRLIRVEYGSGATVVYTYDEIGNRTESRIQDTMPPSNPTSCIETHGVANNTWQNSVSDPAFTWSGASDSGSGVKGYYWYFGTDQSADPTTWTITSGCDPSAVSSGTYYLRVKTEDNAGNRSSPGTLFTFKYDGTSPSGTILIDSGALFTIYTNVILTLSCADNVGCSQMKFSNDGSSYSTPEPYGTSKAWTLISGDGTKTVYVKFGDSAGNWSIPYSDTIVLNTSCSNPPVRIGSTSYTTLQSAYNAAAGGDVIKCQGVRRTDNITVNRNIIVTLEGGYDCGYTTNMGNMTPIKGMITTTSGGGTITIKNFTLEK